jgi:hypothetical protein
MKSRGRTEPGGYLQKKNDKKRRPAKTGGVFYCAPPVIQAACASTSVA